MRRTGLALALLVLAARGAAAKLDGPEWLAAEQKARTLFAQPGDAEGKALAVKEVLRDGEPRAWKLLADATLLECGHLARTGEKLSKALTELQGLIGKKASEMFPQDRENMYRLQGEVSDLEAVRAGCNATVDVLVRAFAGGDEPARRQLLALARGHKEWVVRATAARVAATAPDEALGKQVLAEALTATQDPRVKVSALEALAKAPGTSWQDAVVARLEDADWGVQVVAARVVGDREMGKAIPVLIKALAGASPRVGDALVAALRSLTGQSIEPYAEPWAKWWEANRSRYGADGRPLQPLVHQPRATDIAFYGLKVRSDKVLFVIDTSGSMKHEKQAPPPTAAPKGATTGDDKPKPDEPPSKFSGPKIEIAKQELRRALRALPKEAMFNIISFNHGVIQWQPKMMAANDANKELAYAWIRDMAPSGSTYIDGALRLGFKMAGMGAYDKAYPGVAVDTIILLSDGAPTDNAFPESKEMNPNDILAHVREWNAAKRVVVHCVGIDNVVQGIEFMKKLAAENGGTYVDG